MSKSRFDVEVAKGVAIDSANDVLLVQWIFRFNKSKSLLHAEIK